MIVDHVHVSHVSKTGSLIPSVGLPPGGSCRPDAPCFKKCYARKGRFAFKHNKNLLNMNLAIWNQDHNFFKQEVFIAAFQAKFFRWFPAGDIPDADFLKMMVDLHLEVPGTRFLAFTKKYELVNDYLDHNPMWKDNLVIVFSAWDENWQVPNPHGLPVAYIRLKDGSSKIPEGCHECPLFCGDCVLTEHSCWDLRPGEAVVFNEH